MKRNITGLLLCAAVMAAHCHFCLAAGFYDSVEDTAVTNHYPPQSGSWRRDSSVSYSLTHSWGIPPAKDAGKGLMFTLATPLFYVPATGKKLSYWHSYGMDAANDTGVVDYTINGGASWVQLKKFTGGSAGWVKDSFDLSGIPAGDSMQVRFRLFNAILITHCSWNVDEILVGKTPLVLLSNGQVGPTAGDTSTMYTFSVAYKSPPEVAPTTAQVTIDGATHALTKASGVYSVGAIYQYQSKLTAGTHAYSFTFVTEGQTFDYPDTGSLSGPQVGGVIFFDDFESGLGKWVLGHGGIDTTDDWHISTVSYHSPSYSVRNGQYHSNANSWVQMVNNMNFTNYSNVNVSWWEIYSTELNADFCRPEISINGGNDWIELMPPYSYDNGGWTRRILDISQYHGCADVKIRYRFTSNETQVYFGWFIDDVEVTAVPVGVTDKPIEELIIEHPNIMCFPNPFLDQTTVRYQLSTAGRVNISVYNVSGQLVKILINEYKGAGDYSVKWDGDNYSGKKVGSGVYFYRLVVPGYCITNRMILVK